MGWIGYREGRRKSKQASEEPRNKRLFRRLRTSAIQTMLFFEGRTPRVGSSRVQLSTTLGTFTWKQNNKQRLDMDSTKTFSFVKNQWDSSVVSTISQYIQIPNQVRCFRIVVRVWIIEYDWALSGAKANWLIEPMDHMSFYIDPISSGFRSNQTLTNEYLSIL